MAWDRAWALKIGASAASPGIPLDCFIIEPVTQVGHSTCAAHSTRAQAELSDGFVFEAATSAVSSAPPSPSPPLNLSFRHHTANAAVCGMVLHELGFVVNGRSTQPPLHLGALLPCATLNPRLMRGQGSGGVAEAARWWLVVLGYEPNFVRASVIEGGWGHGAARREAEGVQG